MADLHILAVVNHHTPLPSQWLTSVYFMKFTTLHPYLSTVDLWILAAVHSPYFLHGWPPYTWCSLSPHILTLWMTDLHKLAVVYHHTPVPSQWLTSIYFLKSTTLHPHHGWPPYTCCSLSPYILTLSMAHLHILVSPYILTISMAHLHIFSEVHYSTPLPFHSRPVHTSCSPQPLPSPWLTSIY